MEPWASVEEGHLNKNYKMSSNMTSVPDVKIACKQMSLFIQEIMSASNSCDLNMLDWQWRLQLFRI